MIRIGIFAIGLTALTFATSCVRDDASSGIKPPPPAGSGEDDKDLAGHAGHGPLIELGTATIGGWSVRAGRDEGAIAAGGDAPVDVWLTEGTGKVGAVRFWIGNQDATGSVKALAAIENPAEPNHYHTHVEIPNPLPDGSQLWVEIQDESGAKSTGSFELKR